MIELDKKNFDEEVMEADGYVFVDFWSESCEPCKALMPKVHELADKYGDKIIYRYKENGGAATARNLALEIATGDYIAFLDSDDIWLTDKTEKQISFMEKVNAMWSHTGFYNWNPDTDIIKKVDNRNDYGYVYEKIFISI